ncbi:MAG: hypothetical protein M1839_001722 [Geoglossum umbratile]|nr:MAG: hypothetical protein M1839_001722 [Geoglossum umbratile]
MWQQASTRRQNKKEGYSRGQEDSEGDSEGAERLRAEGAEGDEQDTDEKLEAMYVLKLWEGDSD